MEQVENMIQQDPDSVEGLTLLCEVYLKEGNYSMALGAAARKIEQYPEEPFGYYQRAFARLGMEEYLEALEDKNDSLI